MKKQFKIVYTTLIVLLLGLLVITTSCRGTKVITERIEVPVVIEKIHNRIDTLNIEKIDSILIASKNDTIFVTKIKYRTKEHKTIIRDTVPKTVTVTVNKETIKEKPVRGFLWKFGLINLIFWIVFLLYKFIIKPIIKESLTINR